MNDYKTNIVYNVGTLGSIPPYSVPFEQSKIKASLDNIDRKILYVVNNPVILCKNIDIDESKINKSINILDKKYNINVDIVHVERGSFSVSMFIKIKTTNPKLLFLNNGIFAIQFGLENLVIDFTLGLPSHPILNHTIKSLTQKLIGMLNKLFILSKYIKFHNKNIIPTQQNLKFAFNIFYRTIREAGIIEPLKQDLNLIQATFYYISSRELVHRIKTIKPYTSNEFKYVDYDKLIARLLYFLVNSDENILILSGKPGVGKTTLIGDLLLRYQKTAKANEKLSANDIACLLDTRVLTVFPSSLLGHKIIIAENAERILLDRKINYEEGIRMLLEMSSGLYPTNIKIITSINTNDNIDHAIMRMGRGNLIEIDELPIDFVESKTFPYAINELERLYDVNLTQKQKEYWNKFKQLIKNSDRVPLCDVFSITKRLFFEDKNQVDLVNWKSVQSKKPIGFKINSFG